MTAVTAEDALLAFTDDNPVTLFHASYLRAVGRLEHTVPDHVLTAIRGGRLLPWSEYRVTSDVPDHTVRVLRHRYKLAAVSSAAAVRPRRSTTAKTAAERAYRPVVETQDSALQARTVEEFMELLRLVAVNSGCNRNQLARRSGLPTSTTYHLLNPANAVLPTKPDQVLTLTRACGLGAAQVDRVMRLWAELRQGRQSPDNAVDTAAPAGAESGVATADDGGAPPAVRESAVDVEAPRRTRSVGRRSRAIRATVWLRFALAAVAVVFVSGWALSQSTTGPEARPGITGEPWSTVMLLVMTLTTTVVTVYGKVRDLRLDRRQRRSPA
jgi:hypothetical protein